MVVPRRLFAFLAALGLAAGLSGVVGAPPVSGQDPVTTTAEVEADSGVTTSLEQVDEGAGSSDQRLATENRRVLAVIGGLVVVALALAILTARYWRRTTPVGMVAADSRPTRRSRRSRKAVSGADHAAADDDWEPRSTGEHTAVAPSPPTPAVRPGPALRRRALGLPAEP